MAMQPVYLVAIANLSKFLEAVRHAQAPDKLTLRFVEELGFKSTNDRLFVPLLKALKFIDDGGKPTGRYHAFLDDTQWKRVLADGIRDAYPDLFRVNRTANQLSRDQLSGRIKSLTEGKFSPAVINNTVKTFLELVKLADFKPDDSRQETVVAADKPADTGAPVLPDVPEAETEVRTDEMPARPTLVYRIEIVLPSVRDQAVYDAIFASARRHLLR